MVIQNGNGNKEPFLREDFDHFFSPFNDCYIAALHYLIKSNLGEFGDVLYAIQIHVKEVKSPGIFVYYRISRARHIKVLRHPQALCDALSKTGLAASKFTGQSDNGSIGHMFAQERSQAERLFR